MEMVNSGRRQNCTIFDGESCTKALVQHNAISMSCQSSSNQRFQNDDWTLINRWSRGTVNNFNTCYWIVVAAVMVVVVGVVVVANVVVIVVDAVAR